jgi:hypothetical protein
MNRPSVRRVPQMPRNEKARESTFRSDLAAAAATAAPVAVTAAAAFLGSQVQLPVLQGVIPWALLAVVLVQAVGLLIARESGGSFRARGWWMVLACTTLLLPALALQASMARTPFVSLGSGSAGDLLLATGEVLALLACMYVWTASVCGSEPSWAPMLWMPAALLVPAVLGSGNGDLSDVAGLRALAIACGVATVAMIVGSLVSSHSRLAVAAIAVVGELLLLLLLRRGPSFAEHHGAIAPVMAMVLVLVAIGSVATMQLAAVAGRSFAAATKPARRFPEGNAGPATGEPSSPSIRPTRR